ncbi:hypothetical protein VNI00_007102 [Paramarasmius palmivorus]|uniref:Ricin B lectin domain-containing protein n=1 Tax=Paramarasmius palmivorus TaxID=297713 RepID=A0AAW0D494_9AGAR
MHARVLALSAFVALAAAFPFQLQLGQATPGTGDEDVYCIVASEDRDGAPVAIQECTTAAYDNRAWNVTALPDRFPRGPEPIAIFGNKCLDVTGGNKVDGTKLQIWTCDSVNPNQQWILTTANTFMSVNSTKCIDLTDGSKTNGNQLQIWECDERNTNQRFFGITAQGTAHTVYVEAGFIPGSTAERPVMVATSNADGAPVALATHNNFTGLYPGGNQTWFMQDFPWSGPITTYDGSKCLDVTNGNDANGQKVQIWSCVEGSTNQQWAITPSGSLLQWVGHNKCLDITDGKQEPGTELQIWDCDENNFNQIFVPFQT